MEFKYTATDKKTGKKISEVTSADNISSLVFRLKDQGLVPLHISESKSAKTKRKAPPMLPVFRSNRVKGKELAIFTRQLAATLSAGLLLTEALETIADDLENAYFRKIIRNIREEIQSGTNFSVALKKYPKIFPVTYVAIVKSGEATGNMHKTMMNLAQYLENSERMKEKVKSAVRYPSFVLGFALFVVAVIVLFLIPKFEGLFANAHAKLPLLTLIVVSISRFCLKNAVPVLISIVVLWIIFLYLLRFPRTRYIIDSFKFKIPIIGKHIIHKAVVSRFCHTLGFLLSGGVGLSTALEITTQVVDHIQAGQAVDKIRTNVISGSTLSDEIRKQKIFPRLVSKMTAVGEKTGRLDDMLLRTAQYYEDELETTLQNLTVLIEPVLIVFIGAIVLLVVLALYLPIFQISTAVR